MRIRTHRDMRVWQDALEAAMAIFHVSRGFPVHERYSLTDQIRRSSRSVAANIAEAWMKRRYQPAFLLKLNDALSESAETQTWLEITQRCGYLSPETACRLSEDYDRIIGKLINMTIHPERWVFGPGRPGGSDQGPLPDDDLAVSEEGQPPEP